MLQGVNTFRSGTMARKRTEAEWETWEFPLEKGLEDFFRERIKEYNKEYHKDGYYIKEFKGGTQYAKGVSDRILCVCGDFVAIELKVGNNKATGNQAHFIREVRWSGGIAEVAYNWKEIKEILNPILKRNKAPLL